MINSPEFPEEDIEEEVRKVIYQFKYSEALRRKKDHEKTIDNLIRMIGQKQRLAFLFFLLERKLNRPGAYIAVKEIAKDAKICDNTVRKYVNFMVDVRVLKKFYRREQSYKGIKHTGERRVLYVMCGPLFFSHYLDLKSSAQRCIDRAVSEKISRTKGGKKEWMKTHDLSTQSQTLR